MEGLEEERPPNFNRWPGNKEPKERLFYQYAKRMTRDLKKPGKFPTQSQFLGESQAY